LLSEKLYTRGRIRRHHLPKRKSFFIAYNNSRPEFNRRDAVTSRWCHISSSSRDCDSGRRQLQCWRRRLQRL